MRSQCGWMLSRVGGRVGCRRCCQLPAARSCWWQRPAGEPWDHAASAPDADVTRILNGPSCSGRAFGAIQSRVLKVGDIAVIPAGVPHGWTAITDEVTYLSVRPDPKKVLQHGYVNPALK